MAAVGALAAGSAVLTGCGGSKPAASAGAADSTTDAAASGEKTTLTLWHIQTSAMVDVIQHSVDRFVAENSQYQVNVINLESKEHPAMEQKKKVC